MKKFLKVCATLLLSLIAIILAFQGVTAIYDFPENKPFTGQYIYNPYQGIDSAQFESDFKKANFHAHQTMMFGNMDFLEYSYDEFMDAYKRGGYDIISISDHQYRHDLSMLPIYEHGYSFTNFHTQCYGAPSVSWLDYTLMALPDHQSQFFISTVSDLPLVGINHPSRLRAGISASILKTLRGYDVMEIDCIGIGPYDIALSEGNYVTLTCNDDAHSMDSIGHRFQNRYNMVGSGDDLSLESVTANLRAGRNYGVQLTGGVSPRGKGSEPRLKKVDIDSDTLYIKLGSVADSIVLIGQNGITKSRSVGTDTIKYVFAANDTYIRPVIYYPMSMFVTLNPLVRTQVEGVQPAPLPIAPTNTTLTVINSICWGLLSIALIFGIIRMWRMSKHKRSDKLRNLYAPLRYVK